MVESDEDNTMGRKRREKGFRGGGEREESSSNSRGSRDHWRSNKKLHHAHGPSTYNKNYGHSPIRYREHSPAMPPYTKRIRRDWDSQENNSYHYPLQAQMYSELHPVREESPGRYAQMLSFKAFLAEQEDHIDESEAITRYTEYKAEFRKNQISDFFLTHKEEEWFRLKYDPILKKQQNDKDREVLRRRLKLCMQLYKEGVMNGIRLDTSRTDDLLNFLDTVVRRFETNDPCPPCINATAATVDSSESHTAAREGNAEPADAAAPTDTNNNDNDDNVETEATKAEKDATKNEDTIAEDVVIEDNSEDLPQSAVDKDKTAGGDSHSGDNCASKNDDEGRHSYKTSSIFLRSLPATVTRDEVEKLCRKYEGFKRVAIADPLADRRFQRRGWLTFQHGVDIKKICWELNSAKTWSGDLGAIVNRELTRRVRFVDSITNYSPVVQFDLEMAIKISKCLDAKWSLWNAAAAAADTSTNCKEDNNSTEGPKQPEAGEQSAEKDEQSAEEGEQSVKEEGELSAKEGEQSTEDFVLTENPFIKAAEEALAAMESQAGTVSNEDGADNQQQPQAILIADSSSKTALDQLLIYLRLVHSIDYYNGVEYQLEDYMPNRCGILHVRCSASPLDRLAAHATADQHDQHVRADRTHAACEPPQRSADGEPPTAASRGETATDDKQLRESVQQWIKKSKERLAPFLDGETSRVDAETAKRLGLKNEEEEVERFITQNTVKVVEDKWCCPLSGKKFKGPEFVRKHIFNKHQDKIDKVRREVLCFNNYVLDPKRPQLPEQIITRPLVPSAMKSGPNAGSHQEGGYSSRHHGTSSGGQSGNHQSSGYHHGGSGGNWNLGGAGSFPFAGGRSSRGGHRSSHSAVEGGPANPGVHRDTFRDGRERETVKYDISYSELEESNFPC